MLCLVAPATAQDKPLTVITRVLPPFVIDEASSYTGFSVELWKAIATEIGRNSEFKAKANVKELLAAVEAGEGELGIAAISITSERLGKFDFSQPMFESGLQILVPQETNAGLGLRQVLNIFTTGAMPTILAILAALVLIPAHLAWFAERRREDRLFSRQYFRGISHAIWWATGASTGQQPDAPRSLLGRVLAWLAIPVSVIFVAYFTAAVTAAITVQQLQGNISGPGDLPGQRIGTTTGSTASNWLTEHNITPTEFQAIADAFAALERRQLDAVVFDAPVLLYYANHSGLGKVQVVGPIFRKENYGIAFPLGSDLRKPVNSALLKLRENGTFDALYARWFGQGG